MRLLLVALGVSLSLFGQSAQVGGRVLDPSGQAVPAAAVAVINEATQTRRDLVTNEEGLYTAPALTPGPYTIRVSKQGFKGLGGLVDIHRHKLAGDATVAVVIQHPLRILPCQFTAEI